VPTWIDKSSQVIFRRLSCETHQISSVFDLCRASCLVVLIKSDSWLKAGWLDYATIKTRLFVMKVIRDRDYSVPGESSRLAFDNESMNVSINKLRRFQLRSNFENRLSLTAGLVWHTMQTNPAVEQNKRNVKCSDNLWNQFGRWGKGLWWEGLAKEPSLEVRMKDCTARVREDKSDDSEGDDCGSEGDYIWRSSRTTI